MRKATTRALETIQRAGRMVSRLCEAIFSQWRPILAGFFLSEVLRRGFWWAVIGLLEDRFFSSLNAWLDAHWTIRLALWCAWIGAVVAACIGVFKWGAATERKKRFAPKSAEDASAPAYWTVTEVISWIAFGEAVKTDGWAALIRRHGITPAEERHRVFAAERMLIERLRDPEAQIDIQGKEKEEGDIVHKPVPHSVFLSDVGFNVFDNQIGLPMRAPIDKILDWKGPNWSEVHIRQSHVRKYWKGGIEQQTLPLLEAARRAYGQTRRTVVGSVANMKFGDDNRQDSTLTWFCWALAERLAIYGNWPPSDTLEKIDWRKTKKSHSFQIINGTLILQERGDDGRYEALYVLTAELPTAIAQIAALAPERDE